MIMIERAPELLSILVGYVQLAAMGSYSHQFFLKLVGSLAKSWLESETDESSASVAKYVESLN
jgi:hypothetical protein